MSKSNSKDTLYAAAQENISRFIFDGNVANVFNDMITRSVPGYATIINMIGVLAGEHAQDNSRCYDLGCSLGASTLSMRRRIRKKNCKIISVDNSQAMADRCKEFIEKDRSETPVEVICDDIQNIQIERASMVVLNFTLQFISPEKRLETLKSIHDGMLPGGVLIISEKIVFDDARIQEMQTQLHHNFKKMNGYSEMEIAQKRTALEEVLIPDTLAQHEDRLTKIGFNPVFVWFQCFNFASIIATKC